MLKDALKNYMDTYPDGIALTIVSCEKIIF